MAAIALGSKITAAVHLTVVRAWLSILATVIVTSGATTRSVILMEAIAPVSRLMWAVHLQDLFVPLTKLPIERATLAAITRNASGMTALVRAVRSAYLLGRVQSSILTAFRVRTTPHTTAITRVAKQQCFVTTSSPQLHSIPKVVMTNYASAVDISTAPKVPITSRSQQELR